MSYILFLTALALITANALDRYDLQLPLYNLFGWTIVLVFSGIDLFG